MNRFLASGVQSCTVHATQRVPSCTGLIKKAPMAYQCLTLPLQPDHSKRQCRDTIELLQLRTKRTLGGRRQERAAAAARPAARAARRSPSPRPRRRCRRPSHHPPPRCSTAPPLVAGAFEAAGTFGMHRFSTVRRISVAACHDVCNRSCKTIARNNWCLKLWYATGINRVII